MADPTQLEKTIRNRLTEIFSSQAGGGDVPDMTDGTVLLETGLDSLGFAILVTQLEEELGYDPFSLATEAYYPTTFRQFVDFYAAHQPA